MASGTPTAIDVVAAYTRGHRTFAHVRLDAPDFRRHEFSGVTFFDCSARGAVFDETTFHVGHFRDCDLSEASFVSAWLVGANFSGSRLVRARFPGALLGASTMDRCDAREADLTACDLAGARLVSTDLRGTALEHVALGRTAFVDCDVSAFCDARITHRAPSYVDLRSVMRSYHHPGLKRFLVDCGVPPLVAEYTIAAAEAEGDALESLMRSTFLSYGGPDEAFARRLYEALRAHGVTTFFFPENARLGRRIGDEVHSRIQEHDRVILVCSRDSLDRPGVRNEIQETFDREARDGGATYLLPIMLDDYVLTGWQDPLAPRVRDRVVGDFRGAMDDDQIFDRAMRRLLAALKRDRP